MIGFDPFTPTQDAFVAALDAGVTAPVHQHVPEKAQPPYVQVGDITAEEGGDKDGGLDLMTVEVACIYRGTERLGLFLMMRQAREALEGVPITANGALLSPPAFLNATAGQPVDGTTYEGILRFQTYAQPA